MTYNEYLKILENEVFNLDKSLLDNLEVKRIIKMLYFHLIEIENTNHLKAAFRDLIRNT